LTMAKRSKKPVDLSQLAASIVKEATEKPAQNGSPSKPKPPKDSRAKS